MPNRRPVAATVSAALAAALVVGLVALPEVEASDEATPLRAPVTPAAPAEPAPSPTTVPLPDLPPGGLSIGSEGPAVAALEEFLVGRRFDPGPLDGSYDLATSYAVMAFEKLLGMEPSGKVDPLVWAALDTAPKPEPMLPDGGLRRVEIDKVRQLLFLYDQGELTLVTHVSTGSGKRYCAPGGCGVAITPAGAHRFMWRVNGWRTSRLGRLYNPVYFTGGGIAVHGYHSVPTHPASHGCVRVPMHIASWFPSKVKQGDPVYVFDGTTEVRPLGAGSPPADRVDRAGGTVGEPPEGWLDGQPPARPAGAPAEPEGSLA